MSPQEPIAEHSPGNHSCEPWKAPDVTLQKAHPRGSIPVTSASRSTHGRRCGGTMLSDAEESQAS